MPAVRRPVRRPSADVAPDVREDDGPDERPAASRAARPARRSADDTVGESPRRAAPRVRDDEDEETPDLREERKASRPDIKGGWGASKENRARSSSRPDRFKVEYKETYIITFLDDSPFASFRQHWIERKGKRSFTCLENDCPLCDMLGDKPSPHDLFNVVTFAEVKRGGETFMEPHVQVWDVGTGVASLLEKTNDDKVDGPLSQHYYKVSKAKSGTSGPTQYTVTMVKDRDLEEDWGIVPLDDDEFNDLLGKAYDESAVEINSRRELKEIAEEELDA